MCLYIGDIGDNDYKREFITIYKVKEPELNFIDQETRDWEVFHFQYPNEKFNAESMLIDAITRELVIGEKNKNMPQKSITGLHFKMLTVFF